MHVGGRGGTVSPGAMAYGLAVAPCCVRCMFGSPCRCYLVVYAHVVLSLFISRIQVSRASYQTEFVADKAILSCLPPELTPASFFSTLFPMVNRELTHPSGMLRCLELKMSSQKPASPPTPGLGVVYDVCVCVCVLRVHGVLWGFQ